MLLRLVVGRRPPPVGSLRSAGSLVGAAAAAAVGVGLTGGAAVLQHSCHERVAGEASRGRSRETIWLEKNQAETLSTSDLAK